MALETIRKTPETILKMTYEEFLQWSDEDTHAEWVDGEVIVQMPPKRIHQATVGFLYELLSLFVRLFDRGEVYLAPFEVRLGPEGPSREPDILFLKTAHIDRMTEERLVGAPDLVVEVISRESLHRDRTEKMHEYAAAGVSEYWVIDPRSGKQRADFFYLEENGTYRLIATEEDKAVASLAIPGFWLRPDWLWQAATANPLVCCLEIEGVATALSAQIAKAQGTGESPQ